MDDSSEIVLIKDKPAILLIPSKRIDMFGHRSLNLVVYEDGSLHEVPDCDIIKMEKEIEE